MPGHYRNGNGRNGRSPRRMGARRAPSSAAGRRVTGGSRYLISTGSGTNTKHYSCPTPNGITTACQDVTNEVNVHATLTGRTELPHRNGNRRVMGSVGVNPNQDQQDQLMGGAGLTGNANQMQQNRLMGRMSSGMRRRPARTANPNGRGTRRTVRGMNRRRRSGY